MIAGLGIAGVAAVVGALLLLLIYYGGSNFARTVGNMMPTLPWPIGASLRNLVTGAAESVVGYVGGLLAATVDVVAAFILHPVVLVRAIAGRLSDLAFAAYWAAEWQLRHVIPAVAADALAHVWAAESTALAYAHNLYADALARVYAAESVALGYAGNLYGDALARTYAAETVALDYAANLYRDALTRIYAAESVALSYAWHLYQDALARIHAAEQAALGYAHDEAAAALSIADGEIAALAAQVPAIAASTATAVIGVTATDIDNVFAPDLAGIIDDAGTLAGVIASDFPDLSSILRSTDLTRAAGVAGELGLSIALSRVAARYLTECGIPNCRNLSKFGRDLQGLLGMVEGGAFLALLAALITDPADTVRPLHDFLTPIADGAITAGREMIGI